MFIVQQMVFIAEEVTLSNCCFDGLCLNAIKWMVINDNLLPLNMETWMGNYGPSRNGW